MRAPQLRRDAPGDRHAHGRPRRHGRRPAPRRDDERGRVHRDRGGRAPGRPAPRDRLRGPPDPRSRTRRSGSPARRPPRGAPLSIALVGNAAEIEPMWAKAGERFDIVTDQTSAHDALGGYIPAEISLEDASVLRDADPALYEERSKRAMAAHCQAILDFQKAGSIAFDYGNNLRAQAQEAGVENAFDYPGFVPAFIRPQFCEGRGPFRWVALSGDPRGHPAHGPRDPGAVPRGRGAAPVDRDGRGAGPVPGAAGADLLAGLRGAAPRGAGVQRPGRPRRGQGADRDRPGPPGLRVRGVAQPRDGGDARRHRRGRRLATAQRAA